MAVKRYVVTTAKHDAILLVKILVLLVAVILVIKLVRVIAHIFVLPPQGILHLAQAIPVRLGVKVVALAPVEIYVMTLVMTLAMIPVAVRHLVLHPALLVIIAALGIVQRLVQMHAKLKHRNLAQVVLMAVLGIVLRPVPMLVKHKHDNRQAEILVMDVVVLVSVIAKAHVADLAYLHVMMVVTQSVVG